MPKANNKTLVNIVDDIPEDKQKIIVNEIIEDYQTDIDGRSSWEAKRDKWYKLWTCHREPKNNPWPGASNVCIPMLAAACNQFHARAYQSIFAPPGMVKTIPVGENDVNRAKNVEKYLNWQTLYEMEEYEEVFDRLLQMLPINGIHFKKLWWDSGNDRPQTVHRNAADIVLPYGTREIETARRIVDRIWLYYDELLDRKDQGLYSTVNFDKIPPKEQGTRDDTDIKATADDVSGENEGNDPEIPRLILECHKTYDLGDKRKPYIFTVDRQGEILLRATKRTYKKGAEKITLNHFIDYHFIPNPEGFNSLGFGHFLEPLTEMANTGFNQIFDSGSLSNTPFGFYGRRAGIKSRQIPLKPGHMQEVEDASQVFFPSMQRVDQVLFQVLGLIQQYVEQFTSTSDYLSGRESKGTKTPTASGTLAIIEQGLVTFAVMTKRVFRSVRKELRLIMLMNQIYLSDTKQYRVMGGEDEIAFNDIKAEDFESVQDIIPIGDPSYASRQIRQQEAMQKYQVLMSSPLIAGNPDLGMKPNLKSMHEALSDVLDTFDTKNKNKLLPPLPEESLTPEMENSMFMQGDYVSPKPGENHQQHIQVHTNFTQTLYFKSLSKDYKQLVVQHMQETAQLAYIEEQERAKMGAQQGPQGGQQGGQPNANIQPTGR